MAQTRRPTARSEQSRHQTRRTLHAQADALIRRYYQAHAAASQAVTTMREAPRASPAHRHTPPPAHQNWQTRNDVAEWAINRRSLPITFHRKTNIPDERSLVRAQRRQRKSVYFDDALHLRCIEQRQVPVPLHIDRIAGKHRQGERIMRTRQRFERYEFDRRTLAVKVGIDRNILKYHQESRTTPSPMRRSIYEYPPAPRGRVPKARY